MKLTVDNASSSYIHESRSCDKYDVAGHARLKVADPLLYRTPDRAHDDSYSNRQERLPGRIDLDSKIENQRRDGKGEDEVQQKRERRNVKQRQLAEKEPDSSHD